MPTGGTPTAFLAAENRLWVATAGHRPSSPGLLNEYDQVSGAKLARVAVGSQPQSIAVVGTTVWVANGSLPGPGQYRGSGTVQVMSIGLHGALNKLRSLPVPGVLAVAASRAGAWALASPSKIGTPLIAYHLGATTARRIATLPFALATAPGSGPGSAVITCGAGLVALGVSSTGGKVWRAIDTRGHIFRSGTTSSYSLACAGTIPIGIGPGIHCLEASPSCVSGTFGTAMAAAVATDTALLIGIKPAEFGASAGLHGYDLHTGREFARKPVPKPGDTRIASDHEGVALLDSATLYAVVVTLG